MLGIDSIEKLASWASALPLIPKVMLSCIILGIAAFSLLVLWTRNPSVISPLQNPQTLPPVAQSNRDVINVEAVLVSGRADDEIKHFDVTISNSSSDPQYLTQFLVRWLYEVGATASIARGEILEPSARYSIEIPINTRNAGTVEQIYIPLNPPIVMPPAGEDGPSLITLRVELHYRFDTQAGSNDWHSSGDWDISYDVRILTNDSISSPLISGRWRNPTGRLRLPAPPPPDTEFESIDDIRSRSSSEEEQVMIDARNRVFQFSGGQVVSIEANMGREGYQLFFYGYLSIEVDVVEPIYRLGPEDRRISALLANGDQASFRLPTSGPLRLELQGIKVVEEGVTTLNGEGEFASNITLAAIDANESDLEGVILSDLPQGFTVTVSWE